MYVNAFVLFVFHQLFVVTCEDNDNEVEENLCRKKEAERPGVCATRFVQYKKWPTIVFLCLCWMRSAQREKSNWFMDVSI